MGESIGSFGDKDARRIAGALAISINVRATVENVVTDNGPTDWWEVKVAKRDLKVAQVWLKGWRAGRTILSIENQPTSACLWPEYAALFAEVG